MSLSQLHPSKTALRKQGLGTDKALGMIGSRLRSLKSCRGFPSYLKQRGQYFQMSPIECGQGMLMTNCVRLLGWMHIVLQSATSSECLSRRALVWICGTPNPSMVCQERVVDRLTLVLALTQNDWPSSQIDLTSMICLCSVHMHWRYMRGNPHAE